MCENQLQNVKFWAAAPVPSRYSMPTVYCASPRVARQDTVKNCNIKRLRPQRHREQWSFCFKFATSCADCWYGLESSQRMMPISMKLINRYSIVTLFLKQTYTLGRLWCSSNGYHYTSKSTDRIARKKIERNCDRWMPVQRIKTNGLWKAHLCTAEVPFDLIIHCARHPSWALYM